MSRLEKKTWPFFVLGEAYKIGMETGREIYENITGRFASAPINMGILAQMIFYAGDGDHLEIGTLFGGSAILAARIKQHYDLDGVIICVDPLEGYYGIGSDPFSNVDISIDVVRENALNFGVLDRIVIAPFKSNPWFLNPSFRFKSAFIDGDHTHKGCLSDWENCRNRVTDFIMFDDYDRNYMGIVKTVKSAICSREWDLVQMNDISVVLAHNSRMEKWARNPE